MTSRSEKMCTVLTDASWCPDYKIAGWACWIVHDNERIKKYDTFYDHVGTSNEAEIKAILNGLWIAVRTFNSEHYHVVTDCTAAMDALQQRTHDKTWHKKMLDIVGDAKVTFKHVKAHTNVKDKRSWVNNWCDFNAKLAMRKLRVQVSGGFREKTK